jgi:hypothetical protein
MAGTQEKTESKKTGDNQDDRRARRKIIVITEVHSCDTGEDAETRPKQHDMVKSGNQ